MDNKHNPSNAVPGANDVVAPAGNENVTQPGNDTPQVDNLSLAEINSLTGRQYASRDAALKGIKETFSFVGKKQETPAPATTQTPAEQPDIATELQRTQASLEETQFYLDNPDYNNQEAKELIKSFSGKPADIVKSDVFQKAFKAIQSVSQNDKSQTVMQPNSRQGASSADYQTDLEAAQASGNWADFLAKHKGISLAEDN